MNTNKNENKLDNPPKDKGVLGKDEPHPCALHAFEYLRSIPEKELLAWQESLARCATPGNRTAEVCLDTLRRFLESRPLTDRYLLGLAWMIRNNEKEIKI